MRKFGKTAIVIVTIVILFINVTTGVSASNEYVLDNKDPKIKIPIPRTYEVTRVIGDLGDEAGLMNEAQDLFIDKDGILYVADTGNNRIIKMEADGRVIGVFKGPAEKELLDPSGIFVDDDGDMYIADTGNYRVLHISPEGEFVEEFSKPDSTMLGETFTFDPAKICINSVGNLYTIKSHSFTIIDAYNNFRGFKVSERLPFSFSEMMVNIFASKDQRERSARRAPPPYSNFVMDEKGIVYATAINTPRRQIQKINSVGANIYRDKLYGEMMVDEKGLPVLPYFVDLAVDKNEIITAIEQVSGKIYQYDQEGNLLAVFGGKGKWKGAFQLPTSIAVDDERRIYVLDSGLNNIQVFEPTLFINSVHIAIKEYSDGKYDRALKLWDEVLRINENYKLAHQGKAKALMKQEKWKEAMVEFNAVQDQKGYSKAFTEYRHSLFRKYFGWIILIIVLIFLVLYFAVKQVKAAVDNTVNRFIYVKGVR